MASKQHYIVSNAQEAEEAAKAVMAHQDALRKQSYAWAHKAGTAKQEQQYLFYHCKFLQVDNKLVIASRCLNEIACFLPMPANFPL